MASIWPCVASGYCVLFKRLDRGTFRIPLIIAPGAREVILTPRELGALFEGIDASMLRRARQIVNESRAIG
ncbi:MAG: IS66 family insertion sequence element accessory protein TnpB [Polyangiaceae bacterium]